MVVGDMFEEVDFLVVGGGPGGYTAALRAAELGRDVTLVDADGAEGLGGACLHVGCIPSKALIEVASHSWRSGELELAGLDPRRPAFDGKRFQSWKGDLVTGLAGNVARLLEGAGVRVVKGRASLAAPDRATVENDGAGMPLSLQFKDAVLAAGSRPTALAALPRDGERVLDSTDALALDALPGSLAVIGGGYIGLELGVAFAKLGSRVTVIEATDRLLPELPAIVTKPLGKRLAALGVTVHTSTLALEHDGERLSCQSGDETVAVDCERVLVAVGRTSNADGLELDRAGLADARADAPDRRIHDRIAMIGDLAPGPALAHKATAEARVAAEALCGRRVAFAPNAIPLVVFCDPEIASAGLTLEDARAQGFDAEAAMVPLAASGRAATLGTRDGLAQWVVDRDSGALLGAHMVGPHASELIAEAVLAIEMAASPEDVSQTIHAHPTLGELWGDAAERLVARD
ncbi:MAG: FAD-dependent oxidoreductase [Thermoleophilaceae bacterium]